MLLLFNFKNFKSFRDETTLDLTATKASEFAHHIISMGSEKVLPIAAIFGANASGKSNVHEAFRYMSEHVAHSFQYGGEEVPAMRFERPAPFLFDAERKEAPSFFEVYFIEPESEGGRTIHYGFTVDAAGVCEEWLNTRARTSRGDFKRIFYRNRGDDILDMKGIDARSQANLRIALEPEALIVSLGAKLKIEKLKKVRDWFLQNEFADFGRPLENFFLSEQLPDDFVDSESVRRQVVEYFSSFDPSIIDFEVEVMEGASDRRAAQVRIDAVHQMTDASRTVTIPLRDESAGTLKMFALFPLLQSVLKSGGILFIDELNARLHPLLVRTFVMTFLDIGLNPNHAQLIFTSHDAWQLNSNLLRRDEVWFAEKSDTSASTLYSLADFIDEDGAKIRKDENYEKNYLLGKYGAIPRMTALDMFREG